MDQITLIKPDDFHLHLRDGAALAAVVGASARRFARAIVMPNLAAPVVSVAQAEAYRRRIRESLPEGAAFEPLMTLYLTEDASRDEVDRVADSAEVHAFKYYPAGATTHSAAGVADLGKVMPMLERMAEKDIPLLIHGEATDPEVDVFDREQVFIDRALAPLTERLDSLRIVLEHVTTLEAAQFVAGAREGVAATITPHHLRLNRNAMFRGGINPHHYCLPVLKRERHRQALLRAATGGNPRFFAGTDSAPHAIGDKESACGCAGIYNAHGALEIYAAVFEQEGRLEALEAFASQHGARFYRLPLNAERVTLRREAWRIPHRLPFGDSELVPFMAGETCPWKLVHEQ